MVLLQRKLYFFKDPEGSSISRGSNFFQGRGPTFFKGGVQMLISIKTHITCDFPGGFWTHYPPSGSTLEKPTQMLSYTIKDWISFCV